jgi:hypothetical protein
MKIYSFAILIFLLVVSVFFLFGLEENDNTIEFIELPNGTLVDARIREEVVEVIFRHFQAIEDGDWTAFRDTLVAQDMVDIYHQIGLMIKYFGDIVNVDELAFHHAMGAPDDSLQLIIDKLSIGEYNPIPRNTGMHIQVIRWSGSDFVTTVELTNKKNEYIVYWILASREGIWQHVNPLPAH